MSVRFTDGRVDARALSFALLTLVVGSAACESDQRSAQFAQQQAEQQRPEGSALSLIIFWSPTDAFAMRRLIRVELRQREGGGFRTTLLGDSIDESTMRTSSVNVPIHGKLDVRVLLVAPTRQADTLARSDWTTIQLEPAFSYWVAVSVGDSSGPSAGLCGPRYTSYPVMRNSILHGDSLLLDIGGMPKTAIC